MARLDFTKLVAFNNNLLALHALMLVENYDHALCRTLLTNMLKAKNTPSAREDFKGKKNQVDQVLSYYAFDACKNAPTEVREFALQCHKELVEDH